LRCSRMPSLDSREVVFGPVNDVWIGSI
jgi:hypothetical protein